MLMLASLGCVCTSLVPHTTTGRKLCNAERPPTWPHLCIWPLVLAYNAINLYLGACLSVLLSRLYRFVCFPILKCCWIYTDEEWSGQVCLGSGSHAKKDEDIDWVRAADLVEGDGQMKLFEDMIEPRDLLQGQVGDCWLIAAIASAAEHPACIRAAFLTPEYNPRGKYRIRLYDKKAKAWCVLTIDDLIPCSRGTTRTMFTQPNGHELWAVLLEKAFAKLYGSYEALDAGSGGGDWMDTAWQALTGDHTFHLIVAKEGRGTANERWATPWISDYNKRKEGPADYTRDELWVMIQRYIRAKSLVAAAGMDKSRFSSGDDGGGLNGEVIDQKSGLVMTHAYSILDARELGLIPGLNLGGGMLGQTKLIQLRNPWGRFEWKGAWSDGSKEWDENPIIKARLRPEDKDDGKFWMPWEDFVAMFDNVCICCRTTTNDLRLHVNEDIGACGVVWGCIYGCFSFFCFCRGCLTLYFGSRSKKQLKSAKRTCCCWV